MYEFNTNDIGASLFSNNLVVLNCILVVLYVYQERAYETEWIEHVPGANTNTDVRRSDRALRSTRPRIDDGTTLEFSGTVRQGF